MDTLIRTEGTLGRITLNRPAALNALSPGMIDDIDQALQRWQTDPQVAAVLIDGAGPRGLCAGGDIRLLAGNVARGEPGSSDAYLATEYAMNARIAEFEKPFIAFMDGIVMGGGVGVSAHGSVRIVTERTRLAMPEVGIGFLPDVGGSFLLSRAPGHLGLHAALTGTSLTAFDAIACGLADHHVASHHLPALAQALGQATDRDAIERLVASVASAPDATGFAVRPDWIETCYAAPDAPSIVQALRTHADPAAAEAASLIERACPMSVTVTMTALRRARALDLRACLALELHLAGGLIRRPDFAEGVRAAIVDKDRNPAWIPNRLDAVDMAEIDTLFAEFGKPVP